MSETVKKSFRVHARDDKPRLEDLPSLMNYRDVLYCKSITPFQWFMLVDFVKSLKENDNS